MIGSFCLSFPYIWCAVPADNLPPVSTTILAFYAGRIAPKWYEIGHALGVGDEVAQLQQTEQNPERKCLQSLEAWIRGGAELACSWEKLLHVLRSFYMYAVAKDIQDELQEMAMANSN